MSIDQTIAKAIAAGWIDCFVREGKVWGYATPVDIIPQVFPNVEKFVTFQEVDSMISPGSPSLIYGDRTREETRAILEFRDWQCRGVLQIRPIRLTPIYEEYNILFGIQNECRIDFIPEILSYDFENEIQRLYDTYESTRGRIKIYFPQEEEWNIISFTVRSFSVCCNCSPVSSYNAILEINKEI
jgi:hypothetical protein